MCMSVQVHATHVCKQRPKKGIWVSCCMALRLIPLRKGLSISLKYIDRQMSSLDLPGSAPKPSAEVTGTFSCILILRGCEGFELKSSHFPISPLTHPAISPAPLGLLSQ